ncbi:hypothetical protein D3C76_1343190 [compost metagenome]
MDDHTEASHNQDGGKEKQEWKHQAHDRADPPSEYSPAVLYEVFLGKTQSHICVGDRKQDV